MAMKIYQASALVRHNKCCVLNIRIFHKDVGKMELKYVYFGVKKP